MFDSQLDVSAQLFRKAGKFQFLSLFGGVAKVLFSRNFCRIYRALRAAKPYPDLFVKSVRCIGKINRKYLAAFLVRQAEQILYLVELVLILPLVEQYLAIPVVDNRLFHNGGRDNIIDFLRDYNRLSVKLSNRFKEILYVGCHTFLGDCLSCFLNQYHLADTLQTSHFINERLHDNDGDNRKEDRIIFHNIQLKYDKPFVQ